jgi:hypothetical protein
MLSPSNLERALLCPASAREADKYPSTAGAAAERGQVMHSVLLPAVSIGDASMIDREIELGTINEDEAKIVRTAFDAISKELKGLEPDFEVAVDFAPWGLPKSGREGEHQADLVWIDDKGRLNVLDFKSGKTKVPDPSVNSQLKAYALGIAVARKIEGGAVLWISQPLVSPGLIRGEVSGNALDTFGTELSALTDMIFAQTDELPFVPGPAQCQWCPARKDCQALKDSKAAGKAAKAKIEQEVGTALAVAVKPGEAISIPAKIEGPIVVLDAELVAKTAAILKRALGLTGPLTKESAERASVELKETTAFEKLVDKARLEAKRPAMDLGKAVDEAAKGVLKDLSLAKGVYKNLLETYAEETKEKVAGVSVVPVWRFEVVEPVAVPLDYLSPDPAKIQAAITAGVRSIPGVTIFETTSAKSTGR